MMQVFVFKVGLQFDLIEVACKEWRKVMLDGRNGGWADKRMGVCSGGRATQRNIILSDPAADEHNGTSKTSLQGYMLSFAQNLEGNKFWKQFRREQYLAEPLTWRYKNTFVNPKSMVRCPFLSGLDPFHVSTATPSK